VFSHISRHSETWHVSETESLVCPGSTLWVKDWRHLHWFWLIFWT